jgi:nucleotide-binding universal stress UspA family protein
MNGQSGFRILVATDFSVAADEALARAIQMGLPLGASICIVHVHEPASVPALEGRTFATSDAMIAHLGAALAERVRRVRSAGLTAESKSLCGSPPAEIVRHARRINADLLILGARGHSNGIRFGAVADEVVHHASQAVLVVPSPQTMVVAHAAAS